MEQTFLFALRSPPVLCGQPPVLVPDFRAYGAKTGKKHSRQNPRIVPSEILIEGTVSELSGQVTRKREAKIMPGSGTRSRP
jgi:hypothetical protein